MQDSRIKCCPCSALLPQSPQSFDLAILSECTSAGTSEYLRRTSIVVDWFVHWWTWILWKDVNSRTKVCNFCSDEEFSVQCIFHGIILEECNDFFALFCCSSVSLMTVNHFWNVADGKVVWHVCGRYTPKLHAVFSEKEGWELVWY